VVCISKNIGNSQLPDEAKADFVFFRFFDVGQRKVVEHVDAKIAGTEGIR